ncbi:hypothetical protein [Endozoicomonas acroporae]|uniref:hypothetical protein n=1 Tax=Endozoicomonas acroporae TaxID=1701104 RepID=UPI003D7AE11B
MASTNIWQQFKALIPEGARIVATMPANNGNGTSQAELRDGPVINVKGEESERHSTECFGRYAYAEKATENLHPITSFSTCRI